MSSFFEIQKQIQKALQEEIHQDIEELAENTILEIMRIAEKDSSGRESYSSKSFNVRLRTRQFIDELHARAVRVRA